MSRYMNARWLIRTLSLLAILVCAPVAFSFQGGVAVNEACATDGCCEHDEAICETDQADYEGYQNKSWWQVLVGC